MKTLNLSLAGWATRSFSLLEFGKHLEVQRPQLVEISKYMVDDNVSIKALRRLLDQYRRKLPAVKISYAGTTDFTACAGFSERDYLSYLLIQLDQARFLGAQAFRFFVGSDQEVPEAVVLHRIMNFAEAALPMRPAFELHKGWESSRERLEGLLSNDQLACVVDFENMTDAGLSYRQLCGIIPAGCILYFHSRNLPEVYSEHVDSLVEESIWTEAYPEVPVLWEPKKLEHKHILEKINEH